MVVCLLVAVLTRIPVVKGGPQLQAKSTGPRTETVEWGTSAEPKGDGTPYGPHGLSLFGGPLSLFFSQSNREVNFNKNNKREWIWGKITKRNNPAADLLLTGY